MSAYKNAARGGDTDFRKKWDRAEYAKLAQEREAKEQADAKARYEAKITGKKVKLDDGAPSEVKAIQARQAQDWSDVVNKSYLVPSGASTGRSRKGKGAGFYCESCDETYKDNNSWIDHINSKQHLRKTGQTYDQDSATLEECIAHLEMLKERRRKAEDKKVYDIDKSLADKAAVKSEERAAKKQKKREEREVKIKSEDIDLAPEMTAEQDEMAKMMGFGGFGTTKV